MILLTQSWREECRTPLNLSSKQPKQSLDPVLWGRLGDLAIRKRYRSKRGGWKLSVNLPRRSTGIPGSLRKPRRQRQRQRR